MHIYSSKCYSYHDISLEYEYKNKNRSAWTLDIWNTKNECIRLRIAYKTLKSYTLYHALFKLYLMVNKFCFNKAVNLLRCHQTRLCKSHNGEPNTSYGKLDSCLRFGAHITRRFKIQFVFYSWLLKRPEIEITRGEMSASFQFNDTRVSLN